MEINRKVLLLNASEEIIKIIDWRRAVNLIESGKAKRPFDYNENYEIQTTSGVYKLPKAIILITYTFIPYDDNRCQPTRKNIFKRDKFTCQYCGFISKSIKNLTIDHVHPRCLGGGDQWENLVTACRKCNLDKGNKLLKECKVKLMHKPRKPKCYDIHILAISDDGKEIWKRWLRMDIK